jgi:CheY-like chemotaxis protein
MPLEVLLVEDNPCDVRLVQETFWEARDSIHLHVAVDGVDALAFLRQEGDYAHSPRPDFILLDIHMPRMDGREVLAFINADATLRTIPTAILTNAGEDTEIERSYELQANCYLQKPVDVLKFQNLVKIINQFWLTAVTLSAPKTGPLGR